MEQTKDDIGKQWIQALGVALNEYGAPKVPIIPEVKTIKECLHAVPAKNGERYFLWIYRCLIRRAKEILAEDNAKLEDPGDWPCGQAWEQLVSTSKSIFMHRARDEAGIPHDEFLAIVRNWPYSDKGMAEMNTLWGD